MKAPKDRADHRHSFGDTRVDRCETCHIASDDPRFARQRSRSRTHPYSAAMGDVYKDGRWERRHKFSDFGCTVCHDGQGRGLTKVYAHGEDEFWPDPLLGYTTQANWRKDNAAHLHGAGVHGGQLRTVPHGQKLRGHGTRNRGAGNSSSRKAATDATASRACPRARSARISPRSARSESSTTCGVTSSIRAPTRPTSVMPQFKLTDEDEKALVIFLKSRRGVNFHRSLRSIDTSSNRIRRAGARQRSRGSRRNFGSQDLSSPRRAVDTGLCLHRLPQTRRSRRRHRAGPQLGRAHPRFRLADGSLQESALPRVGFDHAVASVFPRRTSKTCRRT